jgi:coniferyl-aldehyde dehydrogenase
LAQIAHGQRVFKLLHYLHENLPFGRVGASGMGAYRDGYRTFSRRKSVLRQATFNASALIRRPYGRFIERLIALLMRN